MLLQYACYCLPLVAPVTRAILPDNLRDEDMIKRVTVINTKITIKQQTHHHNTWVLVVIVIAVIVVVVMVVVPASI